MTTAIIYKDRMLPPEIQIEFTRWYVQAEENNPCTIEHLECTRCGSTVSALNAELHIQWHKNMSVDMFLFQKFVQDHVQQHIAFDEGMGQLFAAVMRQAEPDTEVPMHDIVVDDGKVVGEGLSGTYARRWNDS